MSIRQFISPTTIEARLLAQLANGNDKSPRAIRDNFNHQHSASMTEGAIITILKGMCARDFLVEKDGRYHKPANQPTASAPLVSVKPYVMPQAMRDVIERMQVERDAIKSIG